MTEGELAQLVARVLSMDKVAGSIPAFSTFAAVIKAREDHLSTREVFFLQALMRGLLLSPS